MVPSSQPEGCGLPPLAAQHHRFTAARLSWCQGGCHRQAPVACVHSRGLFPVLRAEVRDPGMGRPASP